jgi:ferrochelatase
MAVNLLPPDHPPVCAPKVGVLIVNLGTPDAPTPDAVRRYLREFLSDRRVVELPRMIWQPILKNFVLRSRPTKSAALYASVWDHDADDSPLRAITRAQGAALKHAFGPQVEVSWAMRYGHPSIAAEISHLHAIGCERILIAPLYPQYCAATTATANDAAFTALAALRWQPAIRTLPPYYDDPAYIDALAASVEEGVAGLPFVPDAILASFHGMPRPTLDKGDPYHCHCRKTARLLGERLGREVRVSFQSRFGAQEWLKPYTEGVLEAMPGEGIKRVVMVAPGFSVDCLETLEELQIRGRESFEHAGGTDFAYLPCLNASPGGIELLRGLIARELAGWVEASH